MDLVVTYDIATLTRADRRRLRQVAKVCEGYGIRVQASVFECRLLTSTQLAQFVGELDDTIDHITDSVHIYTVTPGPAGPRHILGKRPPHRLGNPWIL